jgi:HlyD family secretion protein
LDPSDQRRAQATISLYNAKQNYNTAVANYNWSIGKPTDNNVNLAEANLAIAQAQLEDAQRQWNILKDGPDPNSIAVAQAKVDAAQATVDMLSVITPFDGDVVAVYNQSNDLVDTSTLAAIIANRKTYSINVQVDETDITKIKVGQAVEVKLDALPDLKLTGVVDSVSLFGQSVSGVVKYDVFVSVQGDKTDLPLGATANVTIQVSQPTTALAVPITAVYSDDQGDYVLLVSGGIQKRVSVQSGDIVGNLVAVTGELKEGDKVLLAQTTTASTTGTTQRGPGFFGP